MPFIFSRILMLALLLFTSLSSSAISTQEKQSVIVIGAGLTGLSAALELQESGLQVTVLEAGTHMAKPIYSFSSDFIQGLGDNATPMQSDDIRDEKVHEQVHGYLALAGLQVTGSTIKDSGPNSALISETAINTAKDSLNSLYYLDGKLISFQDLNRIFAQNISPDYQRFWQAFNQLTPKQVSKLETEIEAQHKLEQPYSLKLQQPLSSQEWLNSLELHPTALKLATHHIEGIYGELSKMSALSLARQQKSHHHEGDRQAQVQRIVGGDSLMANALASTLKNPVLLNQNITSIENSKTGVVIKAAGKTFSANQLLITQALPDLAKLNISPALPDRILSSSQHLNYGAYNKVLLQYQAGFMALVNSSNHPALPMGWNLAQSRESAQLNHTLVTYTAGSLINGQTYNSSEHIIAIKRAQLAAKFPGIDQMFVSANVQAWHREPWPGGNYITYNEQEIKTYWSNFKLPVGNIYFASGQFDKRFAGTFAGAARAGIQTAKTISQHVYIETSSKLASGY